MIKVHFNNLKTIEKDNKKIIKGVVSDETLDRDHEIMRAKGCDITNFQKNPIVLFNHDFNKPVGKAVNITIEEDKVIAEIELSGIDNEAEKIIKAVEEGIINAFSVGFIVKKYINPTDTNIKEIEKTDPEFYKRNKEKLKDAIGIIFEWELYEISLVSVPANPNALIKAKSLGIEPVFLLSCSGECFNDISISEKELILLNQKGVIPYNVHPQDMKVRNSTKWDKEKAVKSLRKWASSDCSGDWEKVNKAKYRVGFGYVKDDEADKPSGYKYPHHYANCNGDFFVDKRGTQVAMLFVLARRGNLTEEEFKALYNHLRKHYENDLGLTPPEWNEKALSGKEMIDILDDDHFQLAIGYRLITGSDIKEYVKEKQINQKNDDNDGIVVIIDE